MRILQIRFKNLNSLAGEWIIDLTQPAFTSDGIFAITGPTGAGKSTILDAICLALYGCTPRLGKITKGGNEIMSRHTGECHAEVTFETQTGLFRSHWSQHRARKKAEGELQNPKHEIVDAQANKPIATALREVADQIESITGLDFERFTRSILLAQGSFAVFLNADPDKRAPILEQITGTGIYSQISIKVHERRSTERKKLETLQAGLKGLRALNAVEEQQYRLELQQKHLVTQQLEQQINQHEQFIAWLENIAVLEQELALLDTLRETLRDRHEAFQPEQLRLDNARKALELAGDYTRLSTMREQQTADQQKYTHLLESIPQQESAYRLAEQVLAAATGNLQTTKQQQNTLRPIFTQVRALDARIKDRASTIQQAEQLLKAQQDKLDTLKTQQRTAQGELADKEKAAAETRQFLAEHRTDQNLVEHFAGIQQQFILLRGLNQQLSGKLAEQASATILQQQTLAARTAKTAALETHAQQIGNTRHTLAQQEEEFRQLLQDKDTGVWRQTLADLKDKKGILERLSRSIQSIGETRHKQVTLHTEQEQHQLKCTALNHQSELQQAKHSALEDKVQRLEERQTLLKTIQSLTEHRHQLKDGEACPLCGSPDHPYATGNIPPPDETANELKSAKIDLKASAKQLIDLNAQQVAVQKDLENNAAQQRECTQKMATEMPLIQQEFSSLEIETTEDGWKPLVQILQQENATRLAETTILVQTAEQHEKAIGALKVSLQHQQETLHQLDREMQQAVHASDSAAETCQRIQQEAVELDAHLKAELAVVSSTIIPYGIPAFSVDELEQVEHKLSYRRQQWIERNEYHNQLEKSLTTLQQQLQHLGEQHRQQQTEVTRQQDALQTLKQVQAEGLEERLSLFGDKQADEEESRLLKSVEEAESQLEVQRQASNAANRELHRLQTEKHAIETTMDGRSKLLQTQEDTFLALLLKIGFRDEADYLAACLPETERQQLAQQAQKLATEWAELETKAKDKTVQLASERGKQLTGQSPEQLMQARDVFKAELSGIQQNIGGIQHKLEENEHLKHEQEAQLRNIDGQQRECTRWDNLHELIGSADGKKYRNFAQGLTFEVMITHANQQLQKMSDRYLLTRNHQQPLELNVIDTYQAGEVRSTRNLSGGESFIVSLALALGLSHMASQNVRVDSLFLDEGFGTLDEDALDTALETLAGLQQDGKLIGVISHVQAMKERISTQIQVSPHTGGRSAITGPGCRRA